MQCKKCGTGFPARVIIDGRRRVLSKRKYCLECSPFGMHNTRMLNQDSVLDRAAGKPCTCLDCGRKFVYVRGQGHTTKRCNSCLVNARRFDKKRKSVEYKGGKCQFCGYDRCISALAFHHLDESTKEFDISGNHALAWERIRIELDKCILVCANCHAEIHAGVRLVEI